MISTSPSRALREAEQRAGLDDRQQIVHFEMKIFGDVVQIFASAAIQQQLEQAGDAAGPGVRQHLRSGLGLLLDGRGRRQASSRVASSLCRCSPRRAETLRTCDRAAAASATRKSARIRPGLRPSTMMRSASSTASSMLWVTIKMLRVGIFLARHRSSSSPRRFSAVSTSSAEKGSSMNRTSGSTASARANPTRCFIPPESSLG